MISAGYHYSNWDDIIVVASYRAMVRSYISYSLRILTIRGSPNQPRSNTSISPPISIR